MGDRKNKITGKSGSLELPINQQNAFRSLTLNDYRALGIKVEKSSYGYAIIAEIVPGSRAESSGSQKGDLFCQNDKNVGTIMSYTQFLQLLSLSGRPLTLTVRPPTDLEKKTFEEEANIQKDIYKFGAQNMPLTEKARKVIQSVKEKRKEHPFALLCNSHALESASVDLTKNTMISIQQSNNISRKPLSMSICTTPAAKNIEE